MEKTLPGLNLPPRTLPTNTPQLHRPLHLSLSLFFSLVSITPPLSHSDTSPSTPLARMENQATFKMVLCGDGGTVSASARCTMSRARPRSSDQDVRLLTAHRVRLASPLRAQLAGHELTFATALFDRQGEMDPSMLSQYPQLTISSQTTFVKRHLTGMCVRSRHHFTQLTCDRRVREEVHRYGQAVFCSPQHPLTPSQPLSVSKSTH